MRFASKVAWLGLGAAGLVGAAWLSRSDAATPPPSALKTSDAKPAVPSPTRADVRWIAAAGGQVPELNQVSLEQDLALAAATFGNGGTVLFAAGAGAPVVQVLAEPSPLSTPADLLADLFAPRGGRSSTYRSPLLHVDGPATAQTVSAALEAAVSEPGAPLLLYLGGHGHRGPTDAENAVGLWGQSELTALDLAALLHDTPRPVLVIATTCFSGGLAELAFADANSQSGAFPGEVCGLFSAPHDLEASGCDPNPDRAMQEGFGLHFLHAIAGQSRDGVTLAPRDIDFDGDGAIAPREAHAYVRIHSEAFDVPTSVSERWLEAVAPGPGAPRSPVVFPEENAVIAALGRKTGLIDGLERARLHLRDVEAKIAAKSEALARAQEAEDRAYRKAASEILARWPVLDDPWHPQFGTMLAGNIDAIREHFASADSYAAYGAAHDEVDRISGDMFDLRANAAPYERLARALEYRRRAARLAAQGGPAWARFELLRSCEFRAPPR
ncbi:MAG: hypothetical protein KUG77_14620 [Nannocystaceae bacterium]|nr:hypothetical protein [Nannocystaceae bacterium]